ncbi:FAD-dependent monooxygenase [uncultured Roseobacter sp.]|uniref:FAD binding domain-containing protein n=1 Tax=uncultured Roseobacter sp. TaxID=114847 RepID=UPI0026101F68|nr:FAD-dependent monooxygenase [uncultured Roseobacter sp.]
MDRYPFKAAIIGGSVGGLATAIELSESLGAEVRVFERSAGEMQARGAGVVMQPEVDDLLRRIDIDTASVCVALRERVSLLQDGTARAQAAPQLMTAWDTLYRSLCARLDPASYVQEHELTDLTPQDDRVVATFSNGASADTDLVIGADGVNSQCRALLTGDGAAARYSGYVAWRGLEDEMALPSHLVEALTDRFTSYTNPGMQMLCYLVPGADGAIEPGRRRVNWVWYFNTPEDQLTDVMTGASGKSYRSFLPASDVSKSVRTAVHNLADRTLPPVFQDLVSASKIFAQPVQDVAAQDRVYSRGLLVGDAAGTVRPHTAAGTSKAFGDARSLAQALQNWSRQKSLPTDRLAQWALLRNRELLATAARGKRLAASSGLGF